MWTSALLNIIKDAHETAAHVSGCLRQRRKGHSCPCGIPVKIGISPLPGYLGTEKGNVSSDQGRHSLTIAHDGYHSICHRKVKSLGFMPCFCKTGTGSAGDKLT